MSRPPEPSQSTHRHYLRQALSLARQSEPKPTNFRVGCVIVSFPTSSGTATSKSEGSGGGGGRENDQVDDGEDVVEGEVLSTGYTLELEGNTHAEQNALTKLALKHGLTSSSSSSPSLPSSSQSQSQSDLDLDQLNLLGERVLTPERNVHLYTTLEPCGKRLSGNTPCVQRIIATRAATTTTTGEKVRGGGIRKVVFGAREPGTFVRDSPSLSMLDAAGVQWEYVGGMDGEILQVAKAGHLGQGQGGGEEGKVTNVDDISPDERRRQEALPRNPKKRMMEVDVPPPPP
ncbi:uncharacterized protein Z520_02097 [Fonsecaea multimorphosa CBS 102226]|uniref:CMP/dCMP-type deaminase domain-containing protein n=1 Tax=Fonsecaea multimorphosa CBS 102226 TaxID=1442371 RepID=A0A0D2KYS7_9EURO|nr:uncharacterized protein Z520_02097 [Fonsecaea multimorphosa CBS 102226]KIY01959.1 hypothetical protein Z520_02097 [Fonsecaea multimorphosa CBS 102226]OAL29641.1 hypothetical protein AYO22_02055 [Fonsecaea multimorphosa]